MKNIAVVGTGYVGLVTGACFAELGHRVSCIDTDVAKVEALKEGIIPIHEPDLEPMVHRNMEAGRFSVTASYAEGLASADFIFITVGTPTTEQGEIDLSYFHSAYELIAANLQRDDVVIVNKSTVPPGTTDMMASLVARLRDGKRPVPIVSNPEFLRESHAVSDFMHPTRVVIGARDLVAAEAVAELHRPLNCPIWFTEPSCAEMIKYASNAFLAMKISFINEIAAICDRVGVNVSAVAHGIGLDPRIGMDFLRAGIGYGGSCLPKDMAVLTHLSEALGHSPRLLKAVIDVNSEQPRRLVQRVKGLLGTLEGAPIGVLGLTFKPHTDDIRRSSALEVVKELQREGARVRACDPQAYRHIHHLPAGVEYLIDPYDMAQGCEAVILATEWPQFRNLDLLRLRREMRGRVFADGRNVMDPQEVEQAGFIYLGVGTGNHAGTWSQEIAGVRRQGS